MKKVVSILLCIAIVLSLAACGGKADNTDTNSDTTGSTGDSQTTDTGDTTSNNSGSDEADGASGGNENSNNNATDTKSSTNAMVTTAEAYKNFKAIFPDKTFLDVCGSSSDPKNHIVKMQDSGTIWRYVTLNANKKGQTVNIMQITDMHVVKLDDRDRKNPVTMNVFEEHSKNKEGMGIANLERIAQYPKYFDFTVGTGDTMDYLTYGGLEVLKKNVFGIKNSLWALGNHDVARTNTNTMADPNDINTRYAQLKEYWPNDLDYASRVVKDTVMIIQLDNSLFKYYGDQAKKLAADIKKARDNNLTVLIFQHMAISVVDVNQSRVNPIRPNSGDPYNFRKTIGNNTSAGVTKDVYSLITQNADIVKGVFCGHLHNDYYSEIHGSYTKDGKKVDAIIPQFVIAGNMGDSGNGMAITVK